MTSEAKIAANQRNAKNSTGPRTERGKSMSRSNALANGLFATNMLLLGENAQEYLNLATSMKNYLAPEGPFEAMLVDQIIRDQWRLRRTDRAEHAFHERVIREMYKQLDDTELEHLIEILSSSAQPSGRQGNTLRVPLGDGRHEEFVVDGKHSEESVKKLQHKISNIEDIGIHYLEAIQHSQENQPLAQIDGRRRALLRDILRHYATLRAIQSERMTISASKPAAD